MADNPMELQQSVETITPDMAAELLERNTNNRPVSQGNVENLAREMSAGCWRLNGEPIIFDAHGNVRDGQHRLLACVRSKVPLVTAVTYGISDDAFATLGRGKTRTISDNLSLQGEINTHHLAAAIALIRNFEKGTLHEANSSTRRLLAGEYQNVLARHPQIRDIVGQGHRRSSRLRNSAITVGHYIAHLVDPAMAAEFMRRLISGENLSAGDPILALRNRLILTPATGSDIKQSVIRIAFMAKALNAYYTGGKIHLLRWNLGDAMPTILGYAYGETIDEYRTRRVVPRPSPIERPSAQQSNLAH